MYPYIVNRQSVETNEKNERRHDHDLGQRTPSQEQIGLDRETSMKLVNLLLL